MGEVDEKYPSRFTGESKPWHMAGDCHGYRRRAQSSVMMTSDARLLRSLHVNARRALELGGVEPYRALVVRQPGLPEVRDLLEVLSPADVVAASVRSLSDVSAVLSALWLRHDFLDESHRFSQEIDTPTGSYWHAIMHRREGDFWNSKYWLNKCRGHPALAAISRQATDVINAFPADKSIMKLTLGDFDAHTFVDLVEAVQDQPADARHELIVLLQQIEWQGLFEHSLRAALS